MVAVPSFLEFARKGALGAAFTNKLLNADGSIWGNYAGSILSDGSGESSIKDSIIAARCPPLGVSK